MEVKKTFPSDILQDGEIEVRIPLSDVIEFENNLKIETNYRIRQKNNIIKLNHDILYDEKYASIGIDLDIDNTLSNFIIIPREDFKEEFFDMLDLRGEERTIKYCTLEIRSILTSMGAGHWVFRRDKNITKETVYFNTRVAKRYVQSLYKSKGQKNKVQEIFFDRYPVVDEDYVVSNETRPGYTRLYGFRSKKQRKTVMKILGVVGFQKVKNKYYPIYVESGNNFLEKLIAEGKIEVYWMSRSALASFNITKDENEKYKIARREGIRTTLVFDRGDWYIPYGEMFEIKEEHVNQAIQIVKEKVEERLEREIQEVYKWVDEQSAYYKKNDPSNYELHGQRVLKEMDEKIERLRKLAQKEFERYVKYINRIYKYQRDFIRVNTFKYGRDKTYFSLLPKDVRFALMGRVENKFRAVEIDMETAHQNLSQIIFNFLRKLVPSIKKNIEKQFGRTLGYKAINDKMVRPDEPVYMHDIKEFRYGVACYNERGFAIKGEHSYQVSEEAMKKAKKFIMLLSNPVLIKNKKKLKTTPYEYDNERKEFIVRIKVPSSDTIQKHIDSKHVSIYREILNEDNPQLIGFHIKQFFLEQVYMLALLVVLSRKRLFTVISKEIDNLVQVTQILESSIINEVMLKMGEIFGKDYAFAKVHDCYYVIKKDSGDSVDAEECRVMRNYSSLITIKYISKKFGILIDNGLFGFVMNGKEDAKANDNIIAKRVYGRSIDELTDKELWLLMREYGVAFYKIVLEEYEPYKKNPYLFSPYVTNDSGYLNGAIF